MNRRETLKMMALAPFATLAPQPDSPDVQRAQEKVAVARQTSVPFAPSFFTEQEYETVRLLADTIIPADERSGSASDVGVPEFIDFMMTDKPGLQTPIRGGLAWLDSQTKRRFGKSFVKSSPSQQTVLLDEIAYPDTAPPEVSQGVAFFNLFRDLTATGFWSSKVGIEDIGYMGNTFVHEWTGAPPDVLEKLGVSYDDA
ncbi:MAG: gluconate 2-dehydrogenase subunit 3 family protein [Rhodothermales bacterium]